MTVVTVVTVVTGVTVLTSLTVVTKVIQLVTKLKNSNCDRLAGTGGGREGGRTNERPETDHVTSGPLRGLKHCTQWRNQTDRLPDGHGDSMTESAQWGHSVKTPNPSLLMSFC